MKQQLGDSNAARGDRLATIWAIVEARKALPAMIVVAGATAADDTRTIARGLAESAYDAGQSAGLLQLTKEKPSLLEPTSYTHLSIAPGGSEREAFDAALAGWRTHYDVVIVDIGDVRGGGLQAHVIRVADGIVLGVCADRRVVAADRELAGLLTQLGSEVMGVVLTAPPARPSLPRPSSGRSRLAPAVQR